MVSGDLACCGRRLLPSLVNNDEGGSTETTSPISELNLSGTGQGDGHLKKHRGGDCLDDCLPVSRKFLYDSEETLGDPDVKKVLSGAVQDTESPSLDTDIHNSPSKKRGRQFHRVISGVQKALDEGKTVRFMTLTSSRNSKRDINDDFEILKKRIRRRYKSGFEYSKIRTNEGYGVLHIVFKGGYIPQSWLSAQWDEIHQAPVVDIRMLKRFSGFRLPGYLAAQEVSGYLSNQDGCTYSRMSWSWLWVYKGFVHTWRMLLGFLPYSAALEMWKKHLVGDVWFYHKKRGWYLRRDGKLFYSNLVGGFIPFKEEKRVLCWYVS